MDSQRECFDEGWERGGGYEIDGSVDGIVKHRRDGWVVYSGFIGAGLTQIWWHGFQCEEWLFPLLSVCLERCQSCLALNILSRKSWLHQSVTVNTCIVASLRWIISFSRMIVIILTLNCDGGIYGSWMRNFKDSSSRVFWHCQILHIYWKKIWKKGDLLKQFQLRNV